VSEQPGNCASCGAPLPAEAKFCPSCGAAVEAETTVRAEVPPHETSPAPATVKRATPRWFGVAPATLLLAIAVVALGAATALLVVGSLVPGLLLLGLALLLLAAFLEVARRKPDAPVAQKAAGAADSLKARAGYTAQALRTRSTARRAIRSRRAQALQLQGERDRLVRALGEVAYRGEDDSALREQIAAVEARQSALQTEAEEIARRADEEVERASRAVQPTEVRPPVGD
jgi:zinc-ribbon domain